MPDILIVDDDPDTCQFIAELLAAPGRRIVYESNPAHALTRAGRDPFDAVISDINLNAPQSGLDVLRAARQANSRCQVVLISGFGTLETAIEAVRAGAFDYISKPFNIAQVKSVVERALSQSLVPEEPSHAREAAVPAGLIGRTAAMLDVYKQIALAADAAMPVLIVGESGTGKELVAEAIHRGSPRKDGPFIAVNGSALTESLAESELFGHEKGAFTGAVAAHPGKFELAHGGTLFLDEVATLPPSIQSKLLRVLESRAFERVGGTKTISVDIRLIAAANENLAGLVAKGGFREDLFYRINTVVLDLPPLRERRDDIPLLVEFFAVRAARRHGRPPKTFTFEALEAMKARPFSGNVRELEHLVEMLTLMAEEDVILPGHLPATGLADGGAAGVELPLAAAVARFEKELLVRAIARGGGVKARAASALGLDPNQMKYLCRKYGL
jgi:DNA-binding NtrC family response regulator